MQGATDEHSRLIGATGHTTEYAGVSVWTPRRADGGGPVRPSRVLPKAPEPGTAVADPALVPSFEEVAGNVVARLAFPEGTSFYGTGEVPGPLLRNGRRTRLWNTDHGCYEEHTDALYQSHPFVLAVLPDGSARGVLADCSRRGTIDLADLRVEFAFEEELFDLYLMEGDEPKVVLAQLTGLVGRLSLPPLWALGYHQCRWSYMDAEEFRGLAREFRTRAIPCDALWFDIDYMEGARVFTWNHQAFPDPGALTDELRAQGFRSVCILDPGITQEVDDPVRTQAEGGEHLVRRSDGSLATGKVWPGLCAFPDFTAGTTREWWAGLVRDFVLAHGIDGLWNDMNEPGLLEGDLRTLPDDAMHAGPHGGGGSHAQWHNLYGHYMVEATRTGYMAARPERRPFVLTRSGQVSTARLAATWTGDNRARWDDLAWSLTMVLNLGLSGQPFAGPDVGGFYDEPTPELFTRWMELGAFLPFFRGHAERLSPRKEPWAFGDETTALVKRAIERRMRLLPTLYTLFRVSAVTGLPVCRPLFFADPSDPRLREVGDAFLLGNDLLVAPVLWEGATRRGVHLPLNGDGWYPWSGGEATHEPYYELDAPLGTVPRFGRAGGLVFTAPVRQHTGQGLGDQVEIHVFPDATGTARGMLYEDAGEGFAYRTGEQRTTKFEVRVEGERVTVREDVRGDFPGAATRRLLVRTPAGVRVAELARGGGSADLAAVEAAPEPG